MNNTFKQYSTILTTIAISLTLLVIYLVVVSLVHSTKAAVTISTVPSDSEITINNKKSSPGTHYLKPGRYTLTATRVDFATVGQTIDVVAGDKKAVTLLPTISSAAADKYFSDHPEEANKREALSGEAFSATSEKVNQKYDFLDRLPILSRDFAVYQAQTVRSKVNPGDAAIALNVVSVGPTDRARAIEAIKQQLGIDPSTIEIIFEAQPNIFSEDGE